jgi:hypothetical protein
MLMIDGDTNGHTPSNYRMMALAWVQILSDARHHHLGSPLTRGLLPSNKL